VNSSSTIRRSLELDRSSYPDFRDRIVAAERIGVTHAPRSYPGYPRVALDRVRARPLVALERTLEARRTHRTLAGVVPSRRELSRILRFAHGVTGADGRGPVPSSGALQALELYCVVFEDTWIEAGAYHYDRFGHFLSQVVRGAERARWNEIVPSTLQFEGGALFWLIVGDGHRIETKYGARGLRFLLLEAGHLMQNLCLLSESLGLCTLPLGGFFERDIASELRLHGTDHVLYAGVCGSPV
jgi:SagB-type dehydrogenase family enzyme